MLFDGDADLLLRREFHRRATAALTDGREPETLGQMVSEAVRRLLAPPGEQEAQP